MIVVHDSNQSSPEAERKNQFAIQIDKLDSETNQYSKEKGKLSKTEIISEKESDSRNKNQENLRMTKDNSNTDKIDGKRDLTKSKESSHFEQSHRSESKQ